MVLYDCVKKAPSACGKDRAQGKHLSHAQYPSLTTSLYHSVVSLLLDRVLEGLWANTLLSDEH